MTRHGNSERETFWQGVIREQKSSELSISAFCRKRGVSEASFFSWRRRMTQRDLNDAAGKFVPLTLDTQAIATRPGYEVVLPDGCRVIVPIQCDANWLARSLKHRKGRHTELLTSNTRVSLHETRRHEEELSRLVPVGPVRIKGGPGIGTLVRVHHVRHPGRARQRGSRVCFGAGHVRRPARAGWQASWACTSVLAAKFKDKKFEDIPERFQPAYDSAARILEGYLAQIQPPIPAVQ